MYIFQRLFPAKKAYIGNTTPVSIFKWYDEKHARGRTCTIDLFFTTLFSTICRRYHAPQVSMCLYLLD